MGRVLKHTPAPALNRQPITDAIAWRDTLLQTVRTLLADHGTADTYFTDPAYLADIDRLWQSYFALIIQLGHDRKLLADITLALWLAHILAVTLDPLGKPSALTPAQLSSLPNATIVLPSAIFPLAPAE